MKYKEKDSLLNVIFMQAIKLEDRFISDYMDVKFEIKDLYLIFCQPDNNCHLELRLFQT